MLREFSETKRQHIKQQGAINILTFEVARSESAAHLALNQGHWRSERPHLRTI